MEDLEILVRVPFESQGVALDWVVEKYLKHDLLSIIYQEKDENECHVFKVTLRSKKSPAELECLQNSLSSMNQPSES
jgi:hypothetical protein